MSAQNKKNSKRSQKKSNRNRDLDFKSNTGARSQGNRVNAIAKELKTLYDIEIRPKNDEYIIDCITGKRTTDITRWPSIRIQKARIITALPTKIKSSAPIRSENETAQAFVETQIEPVLGVRLRSLLKSRISDVFHDFDYDGLNQQIDDVDRVKMVTNGSSYPQLLAPPIGGVNGNTAMLCAMAVGRDIYKSDFTVENVFKSCADGKFITVPKNYKTGRGITIASRTLVDEQQVISVALRDHVTLRSRNSNHIIQFDDQTVQHKLLLEGYATIDLSSASDRVFRSLIKDVWPEFYTHFEKLLPKDVLLPDGRVINLTCVGTQGFPLTFTLMAIICGLIVEAVKFSTYPSSNYGDDIIVHESDFDEVYVALEALGLKINRNKTHKSSDGFLESCGRDIMFTSNGSRDITPVYLRGTKDVEIIQFFFQLCDAKLIEAKDATGILTRLNVEFYAFEYKFQQSEFHFPFGDNVNVPKAQWSHEKSQYMCKVPQLVEEVISIKGLSLKESSLVLELLHIEAGLKNPKNSEKYKRGSDPIAKQYGLMDLKDNKLYSLYRSLDSVEAQVPVIFYEELERQYDTTFKALMFYRFITSEMHRYKYSTPTVDFSSYVTVATTLQEFIATEFGIFSETKYPIYRYKTNKEYKSISHQIKHKVT